MKKKLLITLIALAFLMGFFGIAAVAQASESGDISFLGCIGLLVGIAVLMRPVIRQANRLVE